MARTFCQALISIDFDMDSLSSFWSTSRSCEISKISVNLSISGAEI